MNEKTVRQSYEIARELYAKWGVDTDKVLETLNNIPISIHCWQGDDVAGFERASDQLTGGIQVTGNYPGSARTPDELRKDIEKVLSLTPGKYRVNLHAIYAETGGVKVERDQLEPKYFANWVVWAKEKELDWTLILRSFLIL